MAREVLGDRPPGHRQAIPVDEALVQEQLHHDGHAADPVEIDHVEPAVRLHVGEVRHAGTHRLEVAKRELDLRLVGDRQ